MMKQEAKVSLGVMLRGFARRVSLSSIQCKIKLLDVKEENVALPPMRSARTLAETVQKVQTFFSEFGICGVDGYGSLPEFEIGWDTHNAEWVCSSENGHCNWRFHDLFARMPEVVCHEYTHAIIDHFRNLGAGKQLNALHESIADVLSVAFMRSLDPSNSSWSIGGLRDLSLHVTMSDFRGIPSSEVDEHDESLVASHAFYYVASRSGSASIKTLTTIWLRALQSDSVINSFRDFAAVTVAKAHRFGLARRVKEAWTHVGVRV